MDVNKKTKLELMDINEESVIDRVMEISTNFFKKDRRTAGGFPDGVAVVPIERHDGGHNYILERAYIGRSWTRTNGRQNGTFYLADGVSEYGGGEGSTGNFMTPAMKYLRMPTRKELETYIKTMMKNRPEIYDEIVDSLLLGETDERH